MRSGGPTGAAQPAPSQQRATTSEWREITQGAETQDSDQGDTLPAASMSSQPSHQRPGVGQGPASAKNAQTAETERRDTFPAASYADALAADTEKAEDVNSQLQKSSEVEE